MLRGILLQKSLDAALPLLERNQSGAAFICIVFYRLQNSLNPSLISSRNCPLEATKEPASPNSHLSEQGLIPSPSIAPRHLFKAIGHIPECTCGKTPFEPSQKSHNPLRPRCSLLPCSDLSETRKAARWGTVPGSHSKKRLRPYSITPGTSPESQGPRTAGVSGWVGVNARPRGSRAFTCSPRYPRCPAAAIRPLPMRPAIPSTDTWMIRAADTQVSRASPPGARNAPETSRSTARAKITAAPGSLECGSSNAACTPITKVQPIIGRLSAKSPPEGGASGPVNLDLNWSCKQSGFLLTGQPVCSLFCL